MPAPPDLVALLDRYEVAVDALEAAVCGLDDASLDRRPAPGEWTPREIVHHVADSETMSTIRLRRLLTEAAPRIDPYDQDAWATLLPYDRPIAVSLAAARAVRDTNLSILLRLADEDWDRAGVHPEHPAPYTLELWLRIYAEHPHEHADQVRRALGA